MDDDVKQQGRFRTRWTNSLDRVFVDLVVEQIQLGNRPNNVFDKKTWGHIRDQFNRQTGLNFNNNQLRKHFDVLRIRYNNTKSAIDQNNNFAMEDSCTIGFDLWDNLAVQTRPEPTKTKECPIFEQLCIIFADNSAGGKYAQSSHYEDIENKPNGIIISSSAYCNEVETPHSEAPSSSRSLEDNVASAAENLVKPFTEFKRKRRSGPDPKEENFKDTMAEALFDMISASKMKTKIPDESKFTIAKCIAALDELQGMISESLYYSAVDLFESENLREVFLSLNGNDDRVVWLQRKCGKMGCV